MAQIVYAVENESARTLSDVLGRRLAIGSFGYPGDDAVKRAADLCGKLLKWNGAKKAEEIKSFKASYPLELLEASPKKGRQTTPAF